MLILYGYLHLNPLRRRLSLGDRPTSILQVRGDLHSLSGKSRSKEVGRAPLQGTISTAVNKCGPSRLTDPFMVRQNDEIRDDLLANLRVCIRRERGGRGKNGRQASLMINRSLSLFRYGAYRWLLLSGHESHQGIGN